MRRLVLAIAAWAFLVTPLLAQDSQWRSPFKTLDWTLIAEMEEDGEGADIYVRQPTITGVFGDFQVWLRMEVSVDVPPEREGSGLTSVRSSIALLEFRCDSKEFAVVQQAEFSEPDLSGRQALFRPATLEWVSFVGDPMMEYFSEYCPVLSQTSADEPSPARSAETPGCSGVRMFGICIPASEGSSDSRRRTVAPQLPGPDPRIMCNGAVINGQCTSLPPSESGKTCYGELLAGRCTGPMF